MAVWLIVEVVLRVRVRRPPSFSSRGLWSLPAFDVAPVSVRSAVRAPPVLTYHEAMKVVQQTSAFSSSLDTTDELAVLCDAHRPLALLVEGENGYHVQGHVDTVQALISIVDGVMLAAKGPSIPMNPTPDEVIAGLREAFPSRVEFADVLVPTASGPAVPACGDFQITPFSAWTCS